MRLVREVAQGSLDSVEIHPREVFRPLVRAGSHAVILVHNHPSGDPTPSADDLAKHVNDAVKPAVAALRDRLAAADWTTPAITAAIKDTLAEHGLKMPQLAMPVRVLVMGTPQTPSVDAMLALHRREIVLSRLQNV